MGALRVADALAHFLYCPAMLGRRSARWHWSHRLHLIPRWLLRYVCDRFERSLADPFDIRPACIDRMFSEGEPAQTVGPPAGYVWAHCNVTMTSTTLAGVPTCYCGEPMQPFRCENMAVA